MTLTDDEKAYYIERMKKAYDITATSLEFVTKVVDYFPLVAAVFEKIVFCSSVGSL